MELLNDHLLIDIVSELHLCISLLRVRAVSSRFREIVDNNDEVWKRAWLKSSPKFNFPEQGKYANWVKQSERSKWFLHSFTRSTPYNRDGENSQWFLHLIEKAHLFIFEYTERQNGYYDSLSHTQSGQFKILDTSNPVEKEEFDTMGLDYSDLEATENFKPTPLYLILLHQKTGEYDWHEDSQAESYSTQNVLKKQFVTCMPISLRFKKDKSVTLCIRCEDGNLKSNDIPPNSKIISIAINSINNINE